MKTIRELLQEGDPLQHERACSLERREFSRQAVLAAASGTRTPANTRSQSRIGVFATATLVAIAASFLGVLVWSLFISNLPAATRLEVKLAEDTPGPGLHEAKVLGTESSVYLHDEIIVTNSDIAGARVVRDGNRPEHDISVEFNASGTEKMRTATANHIGRPVAILINGQVVMAPVLRTPIAASAVVNGNYTSAQAEKMVKGMGIQ